jgi:hypothetical protein
MLTVRHRFSVNILICEIFCPPTLNYLGIYFKYRLLSVYFLMLKWDMFASFLTRVHINDGRTLLMC